MDTEKAPIKEVVIMENGKAVKWRVERVEEGGEFTNHDPRVANFHAKTLTVHIKRECDGND